MLPIINKHENAKSLKKSILKGKEYEPLPTNHRSHSYSNKEWLKMLHILDHPKKRTKLILIFS